MMRFFKWLAGLVAIVLAGGAVWLAVSPPAMIRVATNYAAKIVCSNVFIAGRDADAVMATDVQAPGHPVFRAISVSVERSGAQPGVTAKLLGLFGAGHAVWRGEGLGCSSAPDGGLLARTDATLPLRAGAANAEALWPNGEQVAPSQDPAITTVLDDAGLAGPGMRAIVVVHKGRIIGERYGEGFDPQTPLLGWSMTKTVTAAIIGALVKEGRLALDQSALYDSWAGDERNGISLESLLEMSSGLAWNEGYGDVSDVTRMLYLEEDMAAFAASKPYDPENGNPDGDGLFNYSSGTSVLLSDIWMRASQNPVSYPWEALFGPLGMTSATFEMDAAGTFVGSSYLYASARDWARFGQLLLQRGAWDGRSLLPAGYVDWMVEPAPASRAPWGGYTYGRHVWLVGPRGDIPRDRDPEAAFDLPGDTYWLRGHDGQTIAVLPSHELVVVRMGLTPSNLNYQPQGLVDALAKAVGG
ncbi:serine hydrolase domain-containing protein [Zhengella sp. ZM62]|uniref:serine hydrolase domain-containing protein n=1 Tax=Zhengella sedimenti TaxID=3390035 RepID=UPI00397564EF